MMIITLSNKVFCHIKYEYGFPIYSTKNPLKEENFLSQTLDIMTMITIEM